jgi:cell division protein FtsX
MASLLVVSVILWWVVTITNHTVDNLEQKLGFYFYLEESIDGEVWASALLQLTQDLKSIGLESVYYSKEQAFERLARSLPDVIDDLEKYDIGNPLPPTLYVPFTTRESYELLRNVVLQYEDFISNSWELNDQIVFGSQEKRVQSVLSASRTTQMIVLGLLVSLIAIMGAFIAYGNRMHLIQFNEQLKLEKLLWASWLQRVLPFFARTWIVCIWSAVLSWSLLVWSVATIQNYLNQSADTTFQWLLEIVDFLQLYQYGVVAMIVVGTVVTVVVTLRRH